MSTRETYKQEIETELGLARERLVELKADIKGFSDAERLKYSEQVEGLEMMATEMRSKIEELVEAHEDSWEQVKGGVDSHRKVLNEAFESLNRALV